MPPELAQAGFVALWHPRLIVVALCFCAAYLAAVGPWRSRFAGSAPVPGRQVFAFLLGLGLIYFAFGSPLDVLSDHYLFSAHMLEHMLLTFGAPPLLWLGTPDWLFRPVMRVPLLVAIWGKMTRPLFALALFNLVFSAIHIPVVYDYTLQNDTAHFLEHAVLLVTALAMWWPALSPLPEMPRLGDGALLLYLFGNEIFQTVTVALLTFATHPLYSVYAVAPRIWGISPLADQQLGGILMKLGAMGSLGPMLWVTFFRWAHLDRGARVDVPGVMTGTPVPATAAGHRMEAGVKPSWR